jgi:hypothetical protein
MSELLKNVDRTMYTFNFSNIVELCFNKTIEIDLNNTSRKLTESEKIQFDNCIDKYMSAFNIVKDNTNAHLERLFNN